MSADRHSAWLFAAALIGMVYPDLGRAANSLPQGRPTSLRPAAAPDLTPPRLVAAGELAWLEQLPRLLQHRAPDSPTGYLLRGCVLRQQARLKRTVADRLTLLRLANEQFRRATERLEKAPALPDSLLLCYSAWAEAALELAQQIGTPHAYQLAREDALDLERKLALRPNTNAGVAAAVRGFVAEVAGALGDRASQLRSFELAAETLSTTPLRLARGRCLVRWAEAVGADDPKRARDLLGRAEADLAPAGADAAAAYWRGRLLAARRDLDFPKPAPITDRNRADIYRTRTEAVDRELARSAALAEAAHDAEGEQRALRGRLDFVFAAELRKFEKKPDDLKRILAAATQVAEDLEEFDPLTAALFLKDFALWDPEAGQGKKTDRAVKALTDGLRAGAWDSTITLYYALFARAQLLSSESYANRDPRQARSDAQAAEKLVEELHLAAGFRASCRGLIGNTFVLDYKESRDVSDLDRALEAYRRALELAPTHPDVRHWREAVEALTRVKPGSPAAEPVRPEPPRPPVKPGGASKAANIQRTAPPTRPKDITNPEPP